MVLAVERNIKVPPSHRLGEKLILTLGVDDNNLSVKHERTQNLQLGGVAFAGARLGKYHGVIILQTKAVKQHQRGIVTVDAVKDAFIAREVKRDKRKYA